MGRKKLSVKEKAKRKWIRQTVKFILNRKVGGPSKLCTPENRNKMAVIAGRVTKKNACATYRKGIRTRRNKARNGPEGVKRMFRTKEWDEMTKTIAKRVKPKLKALRATRKAQPGKSRVEPRPRLGYDDHMDMSMADLLLDDILPPVLPPAPKKIRIHYKKGGVRVEPRPDEVNDFDDWYDEYMARVEPDEAFYEMFGPTRKLYAPKGRKNPGLLNLK